MGAYSIGEALNIFLERSQWKHRVFELRMRQEWETIMGKTIAKYTRSVQLINRKLTIYTDVAALKQELVMGREQLVVNINEYFGEKVVDEIIVK